MKEVSDQEIILYELFFYGGLMFLIAIGRVIYLKLRDLEIATSTKGRIAKLRKGELTRHQVARDLDIPYHTLQNITREKYLSVIGRLREGIMVNDYHILYAGPVDNNQFLVYTELKSLDYYENDEQELVSTTVKSHHDFLLKYNPSNSTLMSYSQLYSDTIDKFRKNEFLKLI